MIKRLYEMVAISRDMNIKREYALFADSWPSSFSLIVCHESVMRVNNELREVVVAFLNHNLSPSTRRDFMQFLFNYDSAKLQEWCEHTIDRLIQGDLDSEWMESTEFAQKLEQELSIKLSLAFNFSPNGNDQPIKPEENYPLSLIFSQCQA